MPLIISFCHPWANSTTPRMTRAISMATSRAGAGSGRFSMWRASVPSVGALLLSVTELTGVRRTPIRRSAHRATAERRRATSSRPTRRPEDDLPATARDRPLTRSVAPYGVMARPRTRPFAIIDGPTHSDGTATALPPPRCVPATRDRVRCASAAGRDTVHRHSRHRRRGGEDDRRTAHPGDRRGWLGAQGHRPRPRRRDALRARPPRYPLPLHAARPAGRAGRARQDASRTTTGSPSATRAPSAAASSATSPRSSGLRPASRRTRS